MLKIRSKISSILQFFNLSRVSERNEFLLKLKKHPFVADVLHEKKLYFVTTIHNDKVCLRGEKHSDLNVFNQIFMQAEFRLITSFFQFNTNQELIIIDAGANIGLTSIYLNNQLKKAHFYCIEPDPENFQLLKINCNSDSGRFTLFQKALAHTKDLHFNIENSFRDGMDWAKSTSENQAGKIEGITLDEIIKHNQLLKIDLLKIDIEGAERFLFSESSDLSFLNIVEVITIEIHDEFQCRTKITDILQKKGFVLMENGELTVGFRKNLFISN